MSYALTYYFTGTTTFHLSYSLTFIHPSPIHPYPFSFFSPSLLSILHFYSLTDRCNGSILLLFLPSILHFYPSILILFSLLPILHFFLLLILLLILFSLLPSPLLYGSFASIHPSILSLSFAFFTIRQRQRQRLHLSSYPFLSTNPIHPSIPPILSFTATALLLSTIRQRLHPSLLFFNRSMKRQRQRVG